MRIRRFITIVALLLVPAAASAQSASATPSTTGTADVGIRGTSTTGDAARYQRYRDMRDGAFLETLQLSRTTGAWLFAVSAEHFGRRDQRFMSRAKQQGRFHVWFRWDQIPMLFSTTTRTFFEGDVLNNGGTLTIADSIQSAGQASSGSLRAQFAANARDFTLKTRRHIAETGFQYVATSELSLRGLFRNTDREGGIPYGGSFGHGAVIELVAPTSHQLRDVEANAEWMRDRYLVRAGYAGSFFHNDVTELTFDNPWRLTDVAATSSRGRLSLPPSSSYVSVNGMASVKLPRRSRATAYVSTGVLKDAGDLLIPNTANTAATNLLPLARQRVDGEATTTAYNLSFTSRPASMLNFSLRARSYHYDNKTPEFAMGQRIAFDNTPSTLATPIATEPFSVLRRNVDADLSVLPRSGTSAGIGYSRVFEERTHRIFEHTVDNVLRVTFDTVANRWVTLRARFEHSRKRGRGFDEGVLTAVGEQPGMRHFDVASRDRKRVTLLGTVTPIASLMLHASVAAGNDDYLQSLFGLRDNNHRVYAAGFDATPREHVMVGLSYAREKYLALARSRQANPGAEFFDERRNWAVDSDDGAHSVVLYADVMQIGRKVDVKVGWDINRAKATYQYITGAVPGRTLPEETPDIVSTLPTPTQLPDVISNLNRGTLDVVYWLSSRLGLGGSYWYEKYEVEDFALDAESTPNLVNTNAAGTTANAVLLGYLYRPYTAQTGWVRLIVRW